MVQHARLIFYSLLLLVIPCEGTLAQKIPVAPIDSLITVGYATGSLKTLSGSVEKITETQMNKEKMILNMISTSVMIQLGRVKGNKMVNMQLSNHKLVERGTRMIMEELGLNHDHAQKLLLLHGSVKNAIDAYRYSQDH